jgi:hypothetical protein
MTQTSAKPALPLPYALDRFLFELSDSLIDTTAPAWTECFAQIPVDPYIKEGYRYKRTAWFRVKHVAAPAEAAIDAHLRVINEMSEMDEDVAARYLSSSTPSWTQDAYDIWDLPQYALQQSLKYNPVHGDMARRYPSVTPEFRSSKDVRSILINYASRFHVHDAIILLQFQRVDCLAERRGLPAIEGWHQDGNRHVGLLLVNRHNVRPESGVSQFARDVNGKCGTDLLFNQVLQPGELVYWNDKKLWHYGTPIDVNDPALDGGRGTRDIVIMSAKTPPQNLPLGPVPVEFRTWLGEAERTLA